MVQYVKGQYGNLHNTTAVTLKLDIDSLTECFCDAALTNVSIYKHSYDGLPLMTFVNASDSDVIEQCLELQNASYHATYSILPALSYLVGGEVTTGQITWNTIINKFAYPATLSLEKRKTEEYAYHVRSDRNYLTSINNANVCLTLAYKSGFVKNLNNFRYVTFFSTMFAGTNQMSINAEIICRME